ncbi:MAG: DUF3489 domain-containing protein [Bryobacteraceae bacterium]
MQSMGWQKHTVRGFMAGAMKKAGHAEVPVRRVAGREILNSPNASARAT